MDHARQVRCSACKTAWTAGAAESAPVLLGEDTPLYRPSPAPEASIAEADAAPDADKPVAKLIREKTKAKAETRKAVAAGVVWGGLAAAMAMLMICAALFRVEVVRLIPSTAGAYAKVGLTVNPVGLAPEAVEAGPGLSNGHAAVIVTGKLRNVQTHAHPAAPLRIILMDKGGRRLADQVLPADEHPLEPGEARPFQLAFLDPPSGVSQVQVEFAFDAMKAHGAPAHGKDHGKPHAETAREATEHGAAQEAPHEKAHASPSAEAEAAHPPKHDDHAAFGLRGPTAPSHVATSPAKVAQPLSQDSPYALPAAARTHAGHG